MAVPNTQWWIERINRSSFFFIALFLHLIVFMMVATWVIFKPNILATPDFEKVYVPPGAPPPPPPQTTQVTVSVPTVAVPVSAPAIVSPNASASFNVPMPDLKVVVDPKVQPQMKPSTMTAPTSNNLAARLPGIAATLAHWRSRDNILNSDNDVHNVVAKFPVYLAEYADGDWNCNNYNTPAGPLTAGCLPNLVYQIGLWSKGNLKGDVIKSIVISSPDLLSDPPPYIFFTGHRDFVLTDAEIENLRKYLQVGGAIWGDSAFAGDGSRFDVAFHREMKRVLPDADKNFEPLPLTHEIFTHSWFPISKAPSGMNYRADPVQIINLDGKLAVIYTPNDYSDMMTMLLKPGAEPAQMDYGTWPPTALHPLYTPINFQHSAAFFYRNYQPDSVEDDYKLSMNILAHLLIRFDKDLQLAP